LVDAAVFSVWLSAVGQLSGAQRQEALRALAAVHDSQPPGRDQPQGAAAPAQDVLSQIGQARQAKHGCPSCGGDDICRWGRASGKPRYRCASCGKTFNPLTGTPLAGLHYPERWPDQARALIAGETIAKAAARCGVDYTTAFRWRHRFLAALNQDKPARLSGIVEADETFILESFKGKRAGLTRAPRKRGGKSAKRGLSKEQIPVLVARDRSGATIDAVLPRLDTKSITQALGTALRAPGELCCDGGRAIGAFARRAGLTLHVLPAPGLPQPEAPEWHINNVNAYHGRLKQWMRRFHGVATANLPSYLSWRRTIEAFGPAIQPNDWINAAAGLGPYQQAMR
jgi:transposase-like protein